MIAGAWTRAKSCAWLVLVLAVARHSPAVADVFPGAGTSQTTGARQGIYMVLRDVGDAPLSQTRIDQIRATEIKTREFYAANSGGALDLRYAQILDVPLALNADRTRPSNWWSQAENYVRNNYGIDPENYYSNVFDVHGTAPDPNQGWAGVAIIPSNNYAIQADITTNWGQIVIDHEMGHRVGAPHSGAWRSLDDANYTPYVWNRAAQRYEVYDSAAHGHQALAYGVNRDEYGNPFDVMGNISRGHFSARAKRTEFNWLSPTQVPDLSDLGAGTYRIYAHDELDVAVEPRNGAYGVEETYASDVLYGLTYRRPAERFSTSQGAFENYNQSITLEYRSGRDGVQFYLGDLVLDLDPEGGSSRNNLERELEVGRSIEEIDFATSFYASSGDGDDFLSHNPPPPRDPWEIVSQWFKFTVLGTSQDSIGSYVELGVEVIDTFVEGDFNDDGRFGSGDVDVFRDNWLTDTTGLGYRGQHERGDLDFSGRVDLNDWSLLRDVFAERGLAMPALFPVPEPTSAALLVLAVAGAAFVKLRDGTRSDVSRS